MATWTGPARRAVIADQVHPVKRGEPTASGISVASAASAAARYLASPVSAPRVSSAWAAPEAPEGVTPSLGSRGRRTSRGRIDGRVEEAALTIDEPLEDDVEQRPRGREPALVTGHLVEREEPLGEVGMVLQDPWGIGR